MRRAVLTVLSTIAGLVMLLSFKTQAMPSSTAVTGGSSASVSNSSGTGSGSSSSTGASSTGSSGSGSGSGSKSYTGASVDTRWGPVQVKITITNGTITAAEAVDYPQNNGRDQEINSYAIPQLNAEAVSANSASIDMVSGATYTSEGYISSLQSALDQAK
jgi:uncharacterized protein with FMN-binding domain